MANSNLEQQIRERIQAFSEELSNLVKQAALESVQNALGGAAPAKRGPGRPKGSAKSSAPAASSGKRSSDQIAGQTTKLLAHIKGNPGLTIERISKAIHISTKDLKLPVIKLLEDKKIKTTGQKRGTKYFAR